MLQFTVKAIEISIVINVGPPLDTALTYSCTNTDLGIVDITFFIKRLPGSADMITLTNIDG